MNSKFKALTKQVLGSAIPSLFVLSGIPVLYHLSVVWMWICVIIALPIMILAVCFLANAKRVSLEGRFVSEISWLSVLIQGGVVIVLTLAEHYWLSSLWAVITALITTFLVQLHLKIKNKETK